MITSLETLRTYREMRALLVEYVSLHRKHPKVEWHDRVMVLDGCDPQRLEKLHGILLANGWIETRVHGESFREAGRLEACYRVTHDGIHALRIVESQGALDEDEREGDEEGREEEFQAK